MNILTEIKEFFNILSGTKEREYEESYRKWEESLSDRERYFYRTGFIKIFVDFDDRIIALEKKNSHD